VGVASSFWFFALVSELFVHSVTGVHTPSVLAAVTPVVVVLGSMLWLVGAFLIGWRRDSWNHPEFDRAAGWVVGMVLATTILIFIPFTHVYIANSHWYRESVTSSNRMFVTQIGLLLGVVTGLLVLLGSVLHDQARYRGWMRQSQTEAGSADRTWHLGTAGTDDVNDERDASTTSEPHGRPTRLRTGLIAVGGGCLVAIAIAFGGYAWSSQHYAPTAYEWGYGSFNPSVAVDSDAASAATYCKNFWPGNGHYANKTWVPDTWHWTKADFERGCDAHAATWSAAHPAK